VIRMPTAPVLNVKKPATAVALTPPDPVGALIVTVGVAV